MKKDMIIIKGRDFIADFKNALMGTSLEQAVEDAGLSKNIIYNWGYRLDANDDGTGDLRVVESVYAKLCEISELDYDIYYIGKAPYKIHAKETHNKPSATSYTQRLRGGASVTTYIKRDDLVETETASILNSFIPDEFNQKISSFRSHMEVYRKLLGLSSSDIEDYGISDYTNIESGKEGLSISTYITISKLFMNSYHLLEKSPIKTAFAELAKGYNDIYVGIIYFADIADKPKRGRKKKNG